MRTLVAVGTPRLASMLADDARGGAPQHHGLLLPRLADGSRGRGGGHRRRGRDLGLGQRDGGGPVVGEELPPALADRVGIGQEAVVHVVDQPCVRAERAARATELGHGPTLPAAVGPGGGTGSVCPAHELSGRPPRPGAAGRARGPDGDLRPRVPRPGRELPPGHAPAARVLDPGLRPAGLPGLPGRRGGGPERAHRGSPLNCGGGAGGGARARSWRWGTAWGATSWWAPPWPSRGPSGPSGPTSRPCPGWGSAGSGPGAGRGWDADVGGPGRGGRALLLAHGQPRGVGPPDRGGPGDEAGRRAGAGGRPAQLPHRGRHPST